MGINGSRQVSQVFRQYTLDETQLCLNSITIDEYLINKEILQQLAVDDLIKLIKKDFSYKRTKPEQSQQERLLIDYLEELVLKYYLPYVQMNSRKNHTILQNQIKEIILISYLIMRDMKSKMNCWWNPVLLKEILKNKSNDSQEFSLFKQIQFMKEKILNKCPGILRTENTYYSKEAQKIKTLKLMYSIE